MTECDGYVQTDARGTWLVMTDAGGLDDATASGRFIKALETVAVEP